MKSIAEMKRGAILYLRSEIDILAEQTSDEERERSWCRANTSLRAIAATGLINGEEHDELAEEIEMANANALEKIATASLH